MRNLFKRHWPLIGIGILVLAVSVCLVRSGKDMEKGRPAEYIVSEEGLKLKDFHYVQNDPEKDMNWTIKAREMLTSKTGNVLNFNAFQIEVNSTEGRSFTLSGEQGQYERDTGRVSLKGDLKVISDTGYTLVTESALLDEKKGLLTTDAWVEISGRNYSIKGEGLVADLKAETARITSSVTASFHEEPKSP